MTKYKFRKLFNSLTRNSRPVGSPGPSPPHPPPLPSSHPPPPSPSPPALVQPAAGESQSTHLLHAPSLTTSKPEPASFLSQRERIWKKAYEEAEREEEDLVKAFEDIVLAKLREDDENPQSASINETTARQRVTPYEMQQYVLKGITRTTKEASVKQEINDGLQAIQAIRGTIEAGLRAAPEAAAVWAIFSLGIEFLSNPITESRENRAGIQYVLCQMEWYWNLTDLLLDKAKCEEAATAIQNELEKSVVRLFQRLLLYQMRSIRLYYRNWVVAVVKDVVRADDWTSQLKDIKETEEIVKRHMDQYNTQESKIWLRDLRETVGALARRHEVENDKQCLSDLHITDPYTDKKNIEQKKGGLLKDSYKWIVEHADFQHFMNETQSGILWIRGDPGKGKTMLLCGLIDELRLSSPAPISYFFCQATGGNRLNTATSVMRGLIYHLARCYPQLTMYVREKYDYKKGIFNSDDAWSDLCDIMRSMLNDPILDDAILIVDALDECSVGLQPLLKFIIEPSSAKWIVSSRNWPNIEAKLGDGHQKAKIHLELNQDSVSQAIASYINFKVQHLAEEKKYNEGMKKAVLQHLSSNANGTFLWVALVCQELSDEYISLRHTPDTLKAFPPGLGPLYGRMLENISKSKDAAVCKDILATALVAYRPTTLQELHALVDKLQDRNEQEIKEIIAYCGSFLTVHGNAVYFIHQSAKDYLLAEAETQILPFGIAQRHHIIFERSLDLLRKTLKRDIYHLQAPGCLIDEVSIPRPDPLASIQYFCLFWVDHFEDSKECELTNGKDRVLSFFKKDYLHWLEALSLFKSISNAGRAIGRLQAYLNKASKDLRDIINDARLFLLSHGGMIEIAPLQVYISALIFSPINSLTRRHFGHELPGWIDVSPRVEERWNACLQTLNGHDDWVTSVAFSHDGQQLASGSADETVKIWDATSGACLQTLEGHDDWVTSVAFSYDGQQLASGSRDKTVKIWDATSGPCLQTLEGHDYWVTSVAFSHDGQQLASGSRDKTVKIWDATSGPCLQTLPVGNVTYCSSTDVGLLDMALSATCATPSINQTSLIPSHSYSYTSSADNSWIMKDGQRVLYLPLNYRPKSLAVVAGNRLALVSSSWRVIIIGFR